MTPTNKTALRAAVLLHERLAGSKGQPQLISLPDYSWNHVQQFQRQIALACQRGWHGAAKRLSEELVYVMQNCRRDLDSAFYAVQDSLPERPLSSASNIYRDILALEDEFEQVDIELGEHELCVTTDRIVLEHLDLGEFQVRLDWHRLDSPSAYRIVALDPHPAERNETVTHPHVQDERLCEGEGRPAIRAALAECRVLDFFLLVSQILNTYARGSAFVELDDWSGANCSDCSATIDHDDSYCCQRCGSELCDDCRQLCTGCEESFCSGCLGQCAACGHGAAIEYRVPGGHTAETLWLPFQALADCERKKDDPVQLEAVDKNRITAQWRDGSVPQIVSYDCEPPADADKFPALPETFAENPPAILQALANAYDSCDPNSFRFALDHLQVRGDHGTIIATDGRQLLVQGGFQFPWTDDVLVPRSKVFASAELPHDSPVQIGRTGNWVAIGVGPWTIYLAVNIEGRYPDVAKHIPADDDVKTRCLLSAADAEPETPAAQSQDRRRIPPVVDPVTNSNGSATSDGNGQSSGHTRTSSRAKRKGEARQSRAGQQDIAGLIQQAEALRTSLRDTLVKTNELLRGLKARRRHSRALQNTLASLRQLKTLGV